MAETDNPKARQLNPFAFPSETNVRFTLLIITGLMLTFNTWSYFGQVLGLITVPEWNQSWIQYVKFVALPGSLAFSMLVIATLIYRGHPNRIRRAKNLRAISLDNDPQFASAIQELVSVSRVSPSPSIEMANGSQSVDGQAFGLWNRYAVRLGNGLRLLLRRNPENFRAVVLHELAHIANKDILPTYFAQAIWVVFVTLTVLPSLVYVVYNFIAGVVEKILGGLTAEEAIRIFTVNLPTTIIALFQIGCMLAFVVAIRGSLLRVREIYADWRARLWGAGDALMAILRLNSSHDTTKRWSYFWRLHPTSQERLDALAQPERLFQIKAELPFFVGVLLGFLAESMFYLGLALIMIVLRAGGVVTQLIKNIIPLLSSELMNSPFLSSFVSLVIYVTFYGILLIMLLVILALGAILAYSLVGALGLEIQREAIADMVVGRRNMVSYLKLWKPAILLAFGFFIGYFLTPFSILGMFAELINLNGFKIALMTVSIFGVAAFLAWLGLIYIRFFARRMMGSHIGITSPRGARRLLTLFTSSWFLIFFPPIVLWHIDIIGLATGGAITFIRWVGALMIVTLGILFQYTIVFGVTWVLVQAYRFFRKPRCPSCNQITKKRYAVGEVCEHCGKDLAPWLFISESSLPNSA